MTIDAIIFIGFLLANLAIGLFYSRGIKNTSEYALGNRDFPTATITSTIIATCIGAGLFSTALVESYRQGLYFIIPLIFGDLIALTITGYFLIPRMVEFFGTLSVAEALGKLYGKHVRIVTAVAGIFLSVGIVALQFKVAANVIELFFNISSLYATALAAIIVILYSAFGGIKAVTFTDLLQFFTFGVIIPLICITIWHTMPIKITEVFASLSHNPLFDHRKIFDINNPRFLSFAFLMLIFIMPGLDPAFFQRISMSKGVDQARKSFIVAGLMIAAMTALICWTSVLLLVSYPDLNPDKLLIHIINNYTITGFKGLVAIGIMATIMSTADSYINSATVLLKHDIISVLNDKSLKPKNELLLLRIVGLCIGISALFLSYDSGSIQQLFLKMLSFYMPVVTVPLLLAIFGFRSNAKVVLIGMSSGAVTVILWPFFRDPDDVVIPAMLANLVAFIIAHLLCGRSNTDGGSKEHYAVLKSLHQQRKKNYSNFIKAVKSFNFISFSKKNFSKSEYSYPYVGLLAMFSIFSYSYLTSKSLHTNHSALFALLCAGAFLCSFVLITYPIWSTRFKAENFIAVFRAITIPFVLVFIPTLYVVLSNFGQFQTMIFLVNIIAFMLLVRWKIMLSFLVLSSYGSMVLRNLIGRNELSFQYHDDSLGLEFKIGYICLLLGSVLITFLKPKQEDQVLLEEMVDHLRCEVDDQKLEISKALELKNTFLRNLQHETNTPLTGIYSVSQALEDLYDKLSEKQRKDAIRTISTSSERLVSYFTNLIDLSKLKCLAHTLKLTNVNLSNLTYDALLKCKKLYIAKEFRDDREFILDIESDIIIKCDEYYLRRTIENIIINAIQYCKTNKITITLASAFREIQLSVKDEGIGIPQKDLHQIFEPFTTSSKTITPAGGRGVGLTLAKMIIDLHKGKITAESDLGRGSTFTILLPQDRVPLYT